MRARSVSVVALMAMAGCTSMFVDDDEPFVAALPPDLAAPAAIAESPAPAPPDLGVAIEDAATGPTNDLATVDLAGPWPVADLRRYGSAEGLDAPILDANPDDAQNIWAISRDALYLLRPGQTKFRRYGNAEGLHVEPFTDVNGNAAVTWLTAVAGGAAGQVFVGYMGYEDSLDPFTDPLVLKRLGNADDISLNADGTLSVQRYELRCDSAASKCWENRSVRRLLYAHSGPAAGHLFVGANHGVIHIYQDDWGDHIHVSAAWLNPDGTIEYKYGGLYGLALTPEGGLWFGGRTAVGLQPFVADPPTWVTTKHSFAFTAFTADHALTVPAGYREEHRGAAVSSDGVAWFASPVHGLASFDARAPVADRIKRWQGAPGLPDAGLLDLAADPDGSLWIVTEGGALLRFDPTLGTAVSWPGVSGVRRISLDASVQPRALYLSMDGGLAVIRAK